MGDLGESVEGLMDKMLLALWSALYWEMCLEWTARGLANLAPERCHELARWFLRGQALSRKPLHDGICSFCGAWLHGACNQNTATSNKCSGPPVNRDAERLFHRDGTPLTESQPPFLLRWSPAFFAREAPAVFSHDPATNKLSLKKGVHAPWLASSVREGSAKTWLYCTECSASLFSEGRRCEFVPFRDRASQVYLRPVHRSGPAAVVE